MAAKINNAEEAFKKHFEKVMGFRYGISGSEMDTRHLQLKDFFMTGANSQITAEVPENVSKIDADIHSDFNAKKEKLLQALNKWSAYPSVSINNENWDAVLKAIYAFAHNWISAPPEKSGEYLVVISQYDSNNDEDFYNYCLAMYLKDSKKWLLSKHNSGGKVILHTPIPKFTIPKKQ